jgi:GNAT superfamily N-acetyltransferase
LYSVRLAAAADIPHLNAIEIAAAQAFRLTPHAFVADFPPVPLAELEAAQSAGRLWVGADPADAPVAFAIVQIIDDAAHIHELDVHPEHARRGLGAQLIAAVCTWAAAAGYPAVTLSTFSDVPWNAPYYARLGFEQLDETELGPELRAIRAAEEAHGLPPAQRVCMRLSLAGQKARGRTQDARGRTQDARGRTQDAS